MRYQNSVIDSNYISGKIDGIQEGKMEGEKAKAIEVAKNLRAIGISAEIIEKTTGIIADKMADRSRRSRKEQ